MNTPVEWLIFTAIVLAFALLLAISFYLCYANAMLRLQIEAVQGQNAEYVKHIERQRDYIAARDKDFSAPPRDGHKFVGQIEELDTIDPALYIPQYDSFAEELGRHHRKDSGE